MFAGTPTSTVAMIVAIILGIVIGGVILTVIIFILIWRFLHATSSAAEPFIRPSSRTVEVGCRPPQSIGRPTVPRPDILIGSERLPRVWDWTPCGTSPATYQPWNARQWYSPDADGRLVPPELSRPLVWKPYSSMSLISGTSGSQNWYRPSYHGGPASPNSGLHHQPYYYSRRVTDPRFYRIVPPLLSINQ